MKRPHLSMPSRGPVANRAPQSQNRAHKQAVRAFFPFGNLQGHGDTPLTVAAPKRLVTEPFCLILMMALPLETWVRFFVWLLIGFAIYFPFGHKRSALAGESGDNLVETLISSSSEAARQLAATLTELAEKAEKLPAVEMPNVVSGRKR